MRMQNSHRALLKVSLVTSLLLGSDGVIAKAQNEEAIERWMKSSLGACAGRIHDCLMEVEHVYDTGLEYPDPRFVVVIDDGQGIDNRILLQMSEDPYAKRGLFWRIEQFVPDIAYANLGTAVSLNELPVPCQQAVVEVLNEG